MSTSMKVLGGVGLIAVLILASGVGKLAGRTTAENYYDGKKEAELNASLTQTASKINQSLPMMVDSETRLDSTVGFNGQFRYNYTLIKSSAEEIDPRQFGNAQRSQLLNSVCTAKEMDSFIRNGVSVTYAYHGKDGKQIVVITIQPSQCESL